MAAHVGDSAFARTCRALLVNGSLWMDSVLFNGRYYVQKIMPPVDRRNIYSGLIIGSGTTDFLNPDFQVGQGCLVDQLVGQYLAHVCDLGYLVDPANVRTTLRSIMKYNYRASLADHFNCMRTFALGDEAALLMASYPDGRPPNPFPYFTEVMTGFEYTAAIGMLYEGMMDDGLKCIRSIRARYDGLKRNPYDEAECGHHYGRAMISWAGLLALSGFQYSAVQMSLQLGAVDGPMFWSNGYAYGTFTGSAAPEGRTVSITALRGDLQLKRLAVRNLGRVEFDQVRTVRAGETTTFTVPANDSTAGVPSRQLATKERLLVVKPPRVVTGKTVFEKAVYFVESTAVSIEGQTPGASLHYTLDGSDPTIASPVYAGPIALDRSATVRAMAAREGRQSIASPPVHFERFEGTKEVEVRPDPAPEYAALGPLSLVDGRRGDPRAPAADWLGFETNDMEAVIDLGTVRPITSIAAGFLSNQGSWIFAPASVEFAAGTTRENMRVVFSKDFEMEKADRASVKDVSAKIKSTRARYVRVRARNVGACPPWHPGAGGKAWLFVDEIAVN
jgi:hypothetical protein